MVAIACDDGRVFDCEPASTALLAIDFQRDFVEPDGGCSADRESTGRLAAVMTAARSAVSAARRAGFEIIHTRESYAADLSDVNPLKREMGYVGKAGPLGRCLIRGEPGCDFSPDMQPVEGERVFDKPGFSAFYETDLQDHLVSRGVKSLVIVGITYQCCVHSTLRDAVDRGYRCLTLDDCCAALTADLEAAVRAIIRSEGNLFGWISDSGAFQAALAVEPTG